MIWVAEIGSAHGGNKSLAFELIRQAKYAGATIAKFQFGWTDEAQMKYAGNINPIRFIDDWAAELKEWCDYYDIELMASIWSMEGLKAATPVMRRAKIAHQLDDVQLAISIHAAFEQVFVSGSGIDVNDEYPTYPPLIMSKTMSGYSSHSHGIADALLAVARGAKYIEKHITLDKTNPFPRDNSFAITPDEFATMVRLGDEMARMR